MKLQGRNLGLRMRGDDVALLHRELQKLGFTFEGAELDEKRFGTGTRDVVLRFQREHGLAGTGVVDEETARRINAEVNHLEDEPVIDTLIVHGRVLNPDGSPVQQAIVKSFDIGLRTETLLGDVPTTAEGVYEIRYRPEQLRPEGKPTADLIVRAYDQAGNELARSELLCRAPSDAVVDLVVGNQPLRGVFEYDALVAAVRPYLGETALGDLERDDVGFLVCSAHLDPHQVATLIVANRLAKVTSAPDWLFYALGRQRVRLQLEAMVLLRRQVLIDAVSAAIEDNIVPPLSDAATMDSLLNRLQAALVRSAFEEPRNGARFSIGGLLGTSLVDRELQEAFLARFLDRGASPEEFWKEIEEDGRFSSEAVTDLRLTLLLGRLARYRPPVLEQLKRLRQNGELKSLRDLARLDRVRWREMLRAAAGGNGMDLPEAIPGETPEDRLEHYITSLRAPIESLFPSDSLRRALGSAPDTEPNLARFLANTEELDLYWTNIDAYLREHRDVALSGIAEADHEAIVARVKGVQRLLRVSPRADQVRVLAAAGFDSALAIAGTPKRQFRKRFVEVAEELKDSLDDAYVVRVTTTDEEGGESQMATLMMMNSAATPDAVADQIHDVAVSRSTFHMQQYMNLDTTFQLWPGAIGGPHDLQQKAKEDAFKSVPDLATLFGSQSFCECEHCRSVYSPAAYLVDLLHFLDDLTKKKDGSLAYVRPVDAPTPIGELLRRRSDIAHVPLTCENTNTPLPYVDLVNEALESFIASHLNASGDWTDVVLASMPIQPFDTGRATAEELRAVPQHVHPDVYAHLARKAVFPMTLPFHRPIEVARAYLGHLGTSRAEVMEVFRTASGPSTLAQVVERLEMAPAQYQIISATTSTDALFDETDGLKPLWAYYGYGSAADLSALLGVPALLSRTGMTLDELVSILKTRFLNPKLYSNGEATPATKVVEIEFPSSPEDDACDVSKMKLTNLDPANDSAFAHGWLDRLHRVLRLWRALGWTVADLDRTLAVLGATIDDICLEKVAAVVELTRTLDRPLAPLLVLWGELDTWGVELEKGPPPRVTHRRESLFAELFLNRAVLQDAETRQVFEDVLLRVGGLLSTPPEMLEMHVPSIAAALAITGEDIERIRDHAGLTSSTPLDLASLSTLSRYAALSKALGIRVRDLITLLRLVAASVDPFEPGDPRPALEFVRTARRVEASKYPIPLLNYLFHNEVEPIRHPAPTRTFVATTLETLQEGLVAIHQELLVSEQPPVDTLRARLEVAGPELLKLESPAGVEQAMAVLDPRQTTFQGLDLTLQDRMKFADDHFKSFLADPADKLFGSELPDPNDLEKAEERFLKNVQTVLAALLPWLRRKLQVTLVVETMANAMRLEQSIMRRLLEQVLVSTDTQQPGSALEYLLGLVDENGTASALLLEEDPPKPPALMIHRIFKAAAYVSGFGMTEAELELFTGPASPLLTFDPNTALDLDLNKLPIAGVVSASDPLPGQLFAVWRALHVYYELREAFPRSEKTLVDYFTASQSNKAAILKEAAGWDENQIAEVVKVLGEPNPPGTLPALIRLQRAMALLKRVGATPNRMFAWAGETPDHIQANEIVQTVKAHYERTRWLEVARVLNDPLRERQRDALVALLLVRLAPGVPIAEWPHPVLKLGTSGAAVKELQQKLNASQTGAALVVDGKFGQQTRAAVIQFQKTYGLATDGIVGPVTWGVLDGLITGPRTANDLLEYFLIDVEMSSCMLTSRIKQAISSVQLFVQRCLLNLEPAVSPAEIDPDRWEWMKHYRISEANKKVFLYPETYILPELRDDKTPFFKELETELRQGELTDETIETAFGNYLHKLDEVARLDIRAFCRERSTDEEIYHVFGRTWNPPYVYYYRRATFPAENDSGEWTAWERIDLDIHGDHLVPVIVGRRLRLFWPIFEEKPDPVSTSGADGDSGLRWEVKLAWSEYESRRWTPKQTTRDALPTEKWDTNKNTPRDEHRARFTAKVDDGELAVTLFRKLLTGSSEQEINGKHDMARRGKFTGECGGWMRVKSIDDSGPWVIWGPDYSFVEGQAFRASLSVVRWQIITAGAPEDILKPDHHNLPFYVLTSAQESMSAKMVPFFYWDKGQSYFARPVVETMEPLLSGEFVASGAGITLDQLAIPEQVLLQEAWGPDPVTMLAYVADGIDL